jgi:hypothetical protein
MWVKMIMNLHLLAKELGLILKLRLMTSEWMTGINELLASANGIRRDDRDKRLISYGLWHSKWMGGVSEQLTSANDALRGWPKLRL